MIQPPVWQEAICAKPTLTNRSVERLVSVAPSKASIADDDHVIADANEPIRRSEIAG